MKERWVIASRASKLALRQAECVRNAILDCFPDLDIVIKAMKTAGDTRRGERLWASGAKGLFTRELEEALLNREADMAVHSLKDLPVDLPEGLRLGAVPLREDPRDVLVSKDKVLLEHLAAGAVVGTSSWRRRAQILKMRPDVALTDLRGNVNTRIRKVYDGPLEAAVLAKAGLVRLNLQEWIAEEFSLEQMLPAVGQGAVAVEVRDDDRQTADVLEPVQDDDLTCATAAERAFLKGLGGGCLLPVGALGVVEDGSLALEGLVASTDGARIIRRKVRGPKSDAETLGAGLARLILDEGGGELLRLEP